jgi:hypothetical protein
VVTDEGGSLVTEIFLSYARADDDVPPVVRDGVGWVRFFYSCLGTELKHRIGREFHFWRDVADIEPDARFARDIEDALRRALLMVAVVSPNYLERPWCRRELEDFIKGQVVADTDDRDERVLKVLKHNVQEGKMPETLRERGSYKFFELDPEKRIEIPFYMAGRLIKDREQAYFQVLNEIAERIVERLKPASVRGPPENPTGVVFVAPPPRSSSVHEIYLALIEELAKQRIVVMPAPNDAVPEALAEVHKWLDVSLSAATLAIHLIGENGGVTPEGADEPIVHVQLRHTYDELRRRLNLRRLIWVPRSINPAVEPHRAFVEALRAFNNAAVPLMPGRDEVETNSYDAFLGLVQRSLARSQPVQLRTGDPPTVAVVASDDDVEFARGTFRSILKRAGALARPPLPLDRSAGERLSEERQHIMDARRAIVLWRSPDAVWVEREVDRLRDWRALGRNMPFDLIAVAVVEPDKPYKENEDPTGPDELLIDLRAVPEDDQVVRLAAFVGA